MSHFDGFLDHRVASLVIGEHIDRPAPPVGMTTWRPPVRVVNGSWSARRPRCPARGSALTAELPVGGNGSARFSTRIADGVRLSGRLAAEQTDRCARPAPDGDPSPNTEDARHPAKGDTADSPPHRPPSIRHTRVCTEGASSGAPSVPAELTEQ